MNKKKIFLIVFSVLIVILIGVIGGASAYLYNFAFEPQKPLKFNCAS